VSKLKDYVLKIIRYKMICGGDLSTCEDVVIPKIHKKGHWVKYDDVVNLIR